MKHATFTIERLKNMPRPPEYVEEIKKCGVQTSPDSITVDQDSECMRKLYRKYYPLTVGQIINKAAKDYEIPHTVSIPKWWPEFSDLFKKLNYDFIECFNLTGSAIHKTGDPDKTWHDIDISIHIKDWHKYREKRIELLKALPHWYNEVPIEYSFHDHYSIFVELDCDRKILYVPSNFNMKRTIDPEITVVPLNDEEDLKKALYFQTKGKPKTVPIRTKSKGLGDTIEKITKATGIKKMVETISKAAGKDCGCAKRKEYLNQVVPYKQ